MVQGQTGKDLADEVRWSKASGASWRRDASGFYYSRYDEPKPGDSLKGVNQNHKVFFHRLGTQQAQDELVFARPDQPEWYLGAEVTEDGRWVVITASKGTNPETSVFLVDLTQPKAAPEPFLTKMDATYEVVDCDGDTFYVVTNKDAPRRRLVAIGKGKPEPKNWKEIIPQAKSRDVLDSVSLVGERFIATWMRDAHHAVELYDRTGKKLTDVALPALGTVQGFDGKRTDSETFYVFTGFTAPPTIYRLDMKSTASTIFRQPKIAFDSSAYETEQVFFKSKDGTRVPMFLVHKKGLVRDGTTPTLLYGYGGFNIPLTPWFSVSAAAWLEMGGLYAVANLRGGGEYGMEWYDAGRLAHKQNVFDDFIAAAEWLKAERYTSTARLAIEGGSNGGLLMGVQMEQRPDLWNAVVIQVPLLDMLRITKIGAGASWVGEYGSPDIPAERAFLASISPYHHLKPGVAYPEPLIVTSTKDDRVGPGHARKFAARMAAMGLPYLYYENTQGGHSASANQREIARKTALEMTYLTRKLMD